MLQQKIVCNGLVPVLWIKDTKNVLSSKKKWKSPKENSLLLSTVCAIFSKLLITLASVYRCPYRSPKMKLDLQSQKTISLLITGKMSLNIQRGKIFYRSDLETTILAYFLSKRLNYRAISLFLQKLSTLTIGNFTIPKRTDTTLQKMWNIREQLRCIVHAPQIMGMTIALIFSLGACIVQIQSVRVNFACTKRLFNLSAEAIINVRNEKLCARCAKFLLKFKQIPFSCRLAKGFTFLKRVRTHFKMLLEMPIVLATFVPTERNANLLAVM